MFQLWSEGKELVIAKVTTEGNLSFQVNFISDLPEFSNGTISWTHREIQSLELASDSADENTNPQDEVNSNEKKDDGMIKKIKMLSKVTMRGSSKGATLTVVGCQEKRVKK